MQPLLKEIAQKKVLISLLAITLLVAVSLPAFSQSKYAIVALLRCSRDQAILDAFDMMIGTSGEGSLDQIVHRPARVFFKNLAELNKKVKNYDALSWLSTDGQQVIFINEKHRNAPPEALAAIIAHEALHNDMDNSLEEEVAGWTKEATVWKDLKQGNPELAALQPGAYPLVDRLNKIEQEFQKGSLNEFVRHNPGYVGLPEHSPGY